jgi:hypothetical protein
MAASPASVARSLSYLLIDITDDEFHHHVMAQARVTRRALRKLIADACTAGELSQDVDPEALARAVEVTLSGSMMAWAFYRRGTAARWIRADLEATLRPFLASQARPRTGSRGRTGR